jgi:hypothetical protein
MTLEKRHYMTIKNATFRINVIKLRVVFFMVVFNVVMLNVVAYNLNGLAYQKSETFSLRLV